MMTLQHLYIHFVKKKKKNDFPDADVTYLYPILSFQNLEFAAHLLHLSCHLLNRI